MDTSPSSIRRSRAILSAALETLKRSPRLAWFPVLTGAALLALGMLGALIVGVGDHLQAHPVAELGPLWAWAAPAPAEGAIRAKAMPLAGILFYVGSHLVVIAGGVAMSHAALEALAGRTWTVRASLALAFERHRAIATYAAISAAVGHLLNRSNRGGRDRKDRGRRKRRNRNRRGLLNQLASAAWWAATYLILPVLAREPRTGIAAIERSAKLFGGTWKEALAARLTLWWIWVPLGLVCALPLAAVLLLEPSSPAIYAIAVGLPALALIAVGLALHCLDTIYRAALYTYAVEGVIPAFFDEEELSGLWIAGSPAEAAQT